VPKAIEAVWKIESTRLIAAIARATDDIGVAEELAQGALVTALELWAEEGIAQRMLRQSGDLKIARFARFMYSPAELKALGCTAGSLCTP
jgi:predicted RNA polymerase sigma factor